jgi:hypothetical protein
MWSHTVLHGWVGCLRAAEDLALSSVANDIAHTSHGMMMAIPQDEWWVFSHMCPAEMVAILRELAQQVRLKASRKSSRGPKKPQAKREGHATSSYVSTAKRLRNRKANAATPSQNWSMLLAQSPKREVYTVVLALI